MIYYIYGSWHFKNIHNNFFFFNNFFAYFNVIDYAYFNVIDYDYDCCNLCPLSGFVITIYFNDLIPYNFLLIIILFFNKYFFFNKLINF